MCFQNSLPARILQHNNRKLQYKRRGISVAAWNIHYLKNKVVEKIKDDNFLTMIQTNDIVCLSETHIGPDVHVSIQGYKPLKKSRKVCESNNNYYGGLLVLIKDDICKGVKEIPVQSENQLWLQLNKGFFGVEEDIFIGYSYISPRDYKCPEKFEEEFMNLNENVSLFGSKGKVIIMGDLNSRIGLKMDYIESDQQIEDQVNFYDPDTECVSRCTQDPVFKNGQLLIDLCVAHKLRVLNGRTIGDLKGKCTYFKQNGNGQSVIDYGIVDETLLNDIVTFEVGDLFSYLSDHCMISLLLKTNMSRETNTECDGTPLNRYIWSTESKERVISEFSSESIKTMINGIDFSDPNINCENKVREINSIFYNVANKTLRRKHTQVKKKRSCVKKQKWYDNDCHTVKNNLKSLDKLRQMYPGEPFLTGQQVKTLKLYKKIIRKKKREFKHSIIEKLEECSENDPKTYWDLLKELKSIGKDEISNDVISMERWETYFRKLFSSENSEIPWTKTHEAIMDKVKNLESLNIPVPELNKEIEYSEINEAINALKSNKACGVDNIPAEMIKCTKDIMLPIYHKLFNAIFNSGQYPQLWNTGLLTPLYKKGDPYSENNYRGIMVNCILAKVLGNILNSRFEAFLMHYKCIPSSQVGFKKKARTSDHIFVLNTLFNKYCVNGSKLYTCFIDLKKAYDKVWREALLYKLLCNGIHGKFYEHIKAMYDTVSAHIKQGNLISNKFQSHLGVKQGDTMSPLLFNLYTSDFENSLDDLCCPVELDGKKVPCLMFADDLVLISRSRFGLQRALNLTSEYCLCWRLEINIDKCKVMILSRGGRMYSDKFYINGLLLENVKSFCYLGFTITNCFSLASMREAARLKGLKAMFKLIKLVRNSELSVKICLKLFDQLVRPVVMYGADIWGVPNLKVNAFLNDRYGFGLEELYDNFPCESVQLMYCKMILGVNKGCSNKATMGEVGRYPLTIFGMCQAIKFHIRLLNCEDDSLLCRARCELPIVSDSLNSLYHPSHKVLQYIGMDHIRNIQVTNKLGLKRIGQKVSLHLENRYQKYWYKWFMGTLYANQKSKTDFLRLVKSSFNYEEYLDIIKNREKRICLTKLRLSNHPLKIEVGRREKIDRKDRVCPFCSERVVEDENHFLFSCARYNMIRVRFPLYTRPRLKEIFITNDKGSLVLFSKFVCEMFEKRKVLAQQDK